MIRLEQVRGEMFERFERMDRRFAQNEQRLSRVEQRLGELSDQIAALREELLAQLELRPGQTARAAMAGDPGLEDLELAPEVLD